MVAEIRGTVLRVVEQAELVRLLGARAGLFEASRNSQHQIVGTVGASGRLALADLLPGSEAARCAARFAAMLDALLSDPSAQLP